MRSLMRFPSLATCYIFKLPIQQVAMYGRSSYIKITDTAGGNVRPVKLHKNLPIQEVAMYGRSSYIKIYRYRGPSARDHFAGNRRTGVVVLAFSCRFSFPPLNRRVSPLRAKTTGRSCEVRRDTRKKCPKNELARRGIRWLPEKKKNTWADGPRRTATARRDRCGRVADAVAAATGGPSVCCRCRCRCLSAGPVVSVLLRAPAGRNYILQPNKPAAAERMNDRPNERKLATGPGVRQKNKDGAGGTRNGPTRVIFVAVKAVVS